MIVSMTGFGKATGQFPNKKITVEIKSLNSKNMDLNVRIPSAYREKELEIRNQIAQALERGKVDFSLFIELNGEETATQVNFPVVEEYIKQLSLVVNGDRTELLKMAVRMPDALKTEREELDPEEYQSIKELVDQALKSLMQYRADEGNVLKTDFTNRIKNIEELLQKVTAMDGDRMAGVKERLRKAVRELQEEVDENRFEQELIYYLEKYDITEEKVRLKNHLDYFTESLNSADSNGKKLGFITQEIGREINTIGSKSNHAPMQQLVVQMKDELEKIKEQLLNVL
jgi:uncharacterized protein (TIGR00255 family)